MQETLQQPEVVVVTVMRPQGFYITNSMSDWTTFIMTILRADKENMYVWMSKLCKFVNGGNNLTTKPGNYHKIKHAVPPALGTV